MSIKYVKTRDVISPCRAMEKEAGIDFFVPKFGDKFMEDLSKANPLFAFEDTFIVNVDNSVTKGLRLLPHDRILIPSGIKVMFDHNRALIASNKSGVATKKGLIFGAQVVDSSYRGEIHISVINTSNFTVNIYENEKLIQFVETLIGLSQMEEISEEDFDSDTERGIHGFGSTNKK